jgi:single-strand DNA-binding protein
MENKLSGVITLILDTQEVSKSFKKRDFVIETKEQYPQKVIFQVSQDRVHLLDTRTVGELVDVSFNVRGREWNGKYFVTLDAWRIEGEKRSDAHATTKPQPNTHQDDLPF